jgi:hypothetical protein
VALVQLLHLDFAEHGQGCCEIHPMSVQCRRFEAVFGHQPVFAGFGERDLGGMHVCALGNVAAHRIECGPSFLLRRVPFAQLLAFTVDDADVDGELITDDGAAAVALSKSDALDLRWQLSTLSHRDMRSEPVAFESRRRLGVRRDKTLDLGGGYPTGRSDLDPAKLPGVKESIDRRTEMRRASATSAMVRSRFGMEDLASGESLPVMVASGGVWVMRSPRV